LSNTDYTVHVEIFVRARGPTSSLHLDIVLPHFESTNVHSAIRLFRNDVLYKLMLSLHSYGCIRSD